MSTHDTGFGGSGGRCPKYESDFAERQNADDAYGQSWNASAANSQKSEVSSMVQGAGRPGQPNIGQRSIFGNGGAAFTQMPTYTPTTRASEPKQPEPQHTYQPQSPAQPAPQAAQPQQVPQHQRPDQTQPQNFGGHPQYQPQSFQQPAQHAQPNGAAAFDQQDFDLSGADPNFPDSIFGDFMPDAGAGPDLALSDVEPEADASFPEDGNFAGYASDASGREYAYQPGEPQYAAPQAYAPQQQPQAYHPQSYAPQQPPRTHQAESQPYHPQQHGHVPPSDPGRQLQAYDTVYDQPPQVALGGAQPQAHAPQEFNDAGGDADFMDESLSAPPPGKGSKFMAALKGRSAVMVASALLGAIALGGALAYAYKQSGGSGGETPIITADNSPVKKAPDQPGGKEFPHKNKLIYDRLTNGNEPESERLVPRQEDVAVPALPPASATAGLPSPVATTDLANPATTQSVDGGGEEGGPRKVKTMVVRPDGSVEVPAAAAAANTAADAANQAAAQPSNVMPVPATQAAPPQQQVAAADPAPAPAAEKFYVQVGAHKDQTSALGIYADLQQKNPELLGKFAPNVTPGTSNGSQIYRLRVGPMASKSAAYKLCGDLKSQGTDCFVAAQ